MEANFKVTVEQQNGIAIIRIEGYFGDEAGKRLALEVAQFLRVSILRFVIDFSKCDFINSIGVTQLLKITLQIVDDNQGRVFLTGVNKLMAGIMSIAGIHEVAEYASDISSALDKLRV